MCEISPILEAWLKRDGLSCAFDKPLDPELTDEIYKNCSVDISMTAPRLSLGCEQIDSLLSGGIPCRSIIEICGEASLGKSTLIYQYILKTCLPEEHGGLNKNALLLLTEASGNVNTARIHQIAQSFSTNSISNSDYLNKIHVVHMTDSVQEHNTIVYRLEHYLMANPETKLIAFDSLAGNSSDFEDYKKRHDHIIEIGLALANIAKRFNVYILVANQIRQFQDSNVLKESFENQYQGPRRHVSLDPIDGINQAYGPLYWSNIIQGRLYLTKSVQKAQKRKCVELHVMYGNELRPGKIKLVLTNEGLSFDENQ